MNGIVSVGAYAPRLRIDADEFADAWGHFDAPGVEQKAVPDADEDALTMAHEAARRALDAGDYDAGDVETLVFGTTTPPMAEEDLTARLTSTLGLAESVQTHTLTGSTRAGVQALEVGLDSETRTLVVASDCPRGAPDSEQEHAAGAGAAAFVLDDDASASVVDRATYVEPYPGTRFRPAGETETTGLGITQYDREAYQTALAGATDALDADVSDVDAAALQAPNGKLPYRAAGTLGLDTDQVTAGITVRSLGDTGAASAPLGLASALDDGATRVLVAGFGSGAGASALLVETETGVPVESATDGAIELGYAAYLRRRGDITSGSPDGGGAYVSVPSWKRTLPQRHRLVAGECQSCGELAFPPSGACQSCGELAEYEAVTLPGTGQVEAITTIGQGGAPPEFVEQQNKSGAFASAVVAFDGPDGERTVSAPAQVVAADDEIPSVGDDVVATIRRIYEQEDVVRYGFKVTPTAIRR